MPYTQGRKLPPTDPLLLGQVVVNRGDEESNRGDWRDSIAWRFPTLCDRLNLTSISNPPSG
ncbi:MULTISPECIES: hypothetical protein [unclassified Coleofasciculus]|uniref:hypothetical protein n=1 Tax=unclassified Coleofasciculus TaxID=2692782 RepID=UPI00187E8CE8|nr:MULTISPECIES: hypothetical protein [unclassified Coleofasciculus]MBE9127911.1 hypothetical protein [Coleofasciculus sp. LEGE 07081]MBE9150623.1 hypothetical protein [Coleofasciculus sp. LEGE 07092]